MGTRGAHSLNMDFKPLAQPEPLYYKLFSMLHYYELRVEQYGEIVFHLEIHTLFPKHYNLTCKRALPINNESKCERRKFSCFN